jgi:hypothetical protein
VTLTGRLGARRPGGGRALTGSAIQDPTANDAALAAALAAWDSGVRVRRRGEPSRSSLTSDAMAMADGHNSNGKLKRSKSSDDESLGDECEYNLQGNLHVYSVVGYEMIRVRLVCPYT